MPVDFAALSQAELILVAVSFAVAIWNTAVGPSGAITFAAMATILPPVAVVPIHAMTETAANVIRTWLLRAFVDWRFVIPFLVGGIAGFAIGIPILEMEPFSPDALRVMLGAFILIATWIPLARFGPKNGSYAGAGGFMTSVLTLFVGATTPLVAAVIGQREADHRRVLGTSAACMLFQHSAKILVFGVIGFSFGSYLDLLILLVAATIVGTWIGKRILMRASPDAVRPLFKAVLTILGLNLIREGSSALTLLPAFNGTELFLIALWFAVGFWNSSVGPTGGVIFASMASVLPPGAVIPLQAAVEVGSGAFRTWLLRLFIDWRFMLAFVVSSTAGFAIGFQLRAVASPSETALLLIMGTAILATTWLPAAKAVAGHRAFHWLVGSGTAFVGLFATGIGPFIASAISAGQDDRRRVVATLSASLIFQHGVKLVLFGALGFSFAAYADLLAAMLAAALAGAWLGARVALTAPQHIVEPLLKLVVTLLALNLLRQGLMPAGMSGHHALAGGETLSCATAFVDDIGIAFENANREIEGLDTGRDVLDRNVLICAGGKV